MTSIKNIYINLFFVFVLFTSVFSFSSSPNAAPACTPTEYGQMIYEDECIKGCQEGGWQDLSECSLAVGIGLSCNGIDGMVSVGAVEYEPVSKCFRVCTTSDWVLMGECAAPAFISTWNLPAPGSITLPLVNGGNYNFTVDWGDGSSDTITTWNQAEKTHAYTLAGSYIVTIRGTIEGFRFANGGSVQRITNISQWGPLKLGNAGAYFYGASFLTITATDILDTSGMTNMDSAFRGSGITTVPNMDQWDMSSVTNMTSMFHSSTFNQDIGAWDTSNVTNMSIMFRQASQFNQDISGWNTSSVTTMQQMFRQATQFNQDISGWDVSNVANMSEMFRLATSFDQNIGAWSIFNVSNMSNMFLGSQLSIYNYNALLRGWCDYADMNGGPSGITFDGGNSQYDATTGGFAAHKARECLTDTYGWTITDGGQVF